MRLHATVVTLVVAILMSQEIAVAQTANILQDGTPVRLRLNRNLSSADAQVGDTVDFEVLDDVRVNDVLVIARGVSALATVTEARTKKSLGRSGRLNVNIDSVRLVNGDKIPLRGTKGGTGNSHTGAMTGGIVAASIIFFPAAPLLLFVKGKDITIPKGHEVTVFVNGDARLDKIMTAAATPAATPAAPAPPAATTPAAPPAASAPPATPPAGSKAMGNAQVLELKRAGFGDDLIINKIKSSPAAYQLEVSDLLELRKEGVSDAVISAMMNAKK